MIYKKHQIQRMAGKLLTEDFNNDERFNFTNVSYGCHGDCLGSIEAKLPHEEHIIQYVFDSYWNSDEYKLNRVTTDRDWRKNEPAVENTQLIKTFYLLSGYCGYDERGVFTDDKEQAENAVAIRRARRDARRGQSNKDGYMSRDLVPGTDLYNKLHEYVCGFKQIKANAPIHVDTYTSTTTEYDFNQHKYLKYRTMHLRIETIYRNKKEVFYKSNGAKVLINTEKF